MDEYFDIIFSSLIFIHIFGFIFFVREWRKGAKIRKEIEEIIKRNELLNE